MADEQDVALTVALAEYEHLREARRANNDQATARFNFFLVVASAATAVAGGLLTGGDAGTTDAMAVAGLGVLVLLLGLTVFVRQVEFVNRAHLYGTALDSVRTYLARRAPEVAPYLIMPTLDAPGVYQGRPPGGRWYRGVLGLAGIVGLINSSLLAAATGTAVWRLGAPAWSLLLAGGLTLAVATVMHVGYVHRRTAAAHAMIEHGIRGRHPLPDGQPIAAPDSSASISRFHSALTDRQPSSSAPRRQ